MRKYIMDNFWWKLLSLLLAALTWLTIWTAFQKDQDLRESPVVTSASRSFPAIPITLMTSTLNQNQYHVDPTTIPVEVSGSTGELAKLQEREIRVFVDVTDAGEEKRLRRIIQLQVPEGLVVTNLAKSPYAMVERVPVAK
jgi:YbbR domain-containing protein